MITRIRNSQNIINKALILLALASLSMVREIVHRPYSKEEVDRWKQSLTSAGSWEKNPWWQRINPLTPSGPTRFVP